MVPAATLVGARLSGLDAGSAPWLLAASNGLLFAASMALNDWCDTAEDAINKPSRPIPSGRLLPVEVLGIAVLLFTAGILLAGQVQPRFGFAAVLVTLASAAYSLRLKQVPLAGNVLVALVTAYPFLCWLLADGAVPRSLLNLILAVFVFRLGAEILKVAEDCEGDGACGIRTLATVRGVVFANRLGSGLLCLGVAVSWPLAAAAETNALYSWLLALSTVIALFSWFRAPSPWASRSLVSLERAIMVLMSLALLLGVHPA